MISSNVKPLVIVFALSLMTGLFTAGCKQKTENAWVNTSSMPGNTFATHSNKGNAKRHNNAIVYLGSNSSTRSDDNFGPRDVDFNFRNLK